MKKNPITLERLLETGTINKEIKEFLEKKVLPSKSVLIAGTTGTGKTTLLEALITLIEADKKILIQDEYKELKYEQENVTLVNNIDDSSLKPSFDYVIINEVKESKPYLLSTTIGHKTWGTIHASTCNEAVRKLIALAELEQSQRSFNFMAKNLDLVIHLSMLPNKTRKLIEIAKVIPDKNLTKTLVKYDYYTNTWKMYDEKI